MSLPVVLAAAILASTRSHGSHCIPGLVGSARNSGEVDLSNEFCSIALKSLFGGEREPRDSRCGSRCVGLAACRRRLCVWAWWPIALSMLPWSLLDCSVRARRVGRKSVGFWGAEPAASLGLYASTCLIAPLLALIYQDWGAWALLACTSVSCPFASLSRVSSPWVQRESSIRIRDAELASANESALAGRRDERLTLAGDLHDEVLPALFKVHLDGRSPETGLGERAPA